MIALQILTIGLPSILKRLSNFLAPADNNTCFVTTATFFNMVLQTTSVTGIRKSHQAVQTLLSVAASDQDSLLSSLDLLAEVSCLLSFSSNPSFLLDFQSKLIEVIEYKLLIRYGRTFVHVRKHKPN